MKKIILLCCIVLSVSVIGVYAGETVVGQEVDSGVDQDFVLADKLLSRLFLSYRNYFRGMFELEVAADAPERLAFVNKVDQNASAQQVLQMNYFINEVQLTPDRQTLAIKISWEKLTQSAGASAPVKTDGNAGIVFKQQADGRWALFQVTGANPL